MKKTSYEIYLIKVKNLIFEHDCSELLTFINSLICYEKSKLKHQMPEKNRLGN